MQADMRHVMAVVVLLGLALPAAPGDTQAETWGWSEPEVHFRKLDLIASGTITATNVDGNPEHIRFLPSDIWKGTPPEGELDVFLSSGGWSLKVGVERVLSLNASHTGGYTFSHYDQGPYSNIKYFPHYFAVVQKYQPRWRVRLEEVIEAPDDAGALLRLARFLRDEGDRPGARSAYERMISLEPENPLGHSELGQLLFRWGGYEPALASLRHALLLAPDDQTVRRTIQHVRLRMGEELDYSAFDFRNLKHSATHIRDQKWGALDLSEQDLRGKDFRGAALSGASFHGTNLDGANLDGVDLSKADFTGASLRNTSLVGANLAGSDFANADLTGAVVHGADFTGASFVDARLNDLAAHEAQFDRANFQGAGLNGADFTDASLQHAFVLGSQFDRTTLDGTKFKGARYDCATVLPKHVALSRHRMIPYQRVCDGVSQNVRFAGTDWSGVDFSGLDLRRADFTNADLKGARFDHADLRGAYFSGANIAYAKFRGANLEGAGFSKTEGAADFAGANLRGTNFSGALGVTTSRFSANNEVGPADVSGARFHATTIMLPTFGRPTDDLPNFFRANLAGSKIDCGGRDLKLLLSEPEHPVRRHKWRRYQHALQLAAQLAEEKPGVRLSETCESAIASYSDVRCDPWAPEEQRAQYCVLPEATN